ESRRRAEASALSAAFAARNIPRRATTANPPEMEDARPTLADALDPASTLSLPVLLLYPLHARSDLVKAFAETDALAEHLGYVLPLPWDEGGEYGGGVECYLETAAGGLVRAGKKVPLREVLGSGRVEMVDGMVRVSVLPKARAREWIEEVKRKRAGGR
ncbi:HSP70/90 co-chaperone, partial [Elasticomyces elasticus]